MSGKDDDLLNFEREMAEKQRASEQYTKCVDYVLANRFGKCMHSRDVANVLHSFMLGDKPFAVLSNRGSKLRYDDALSMLWLLITTDMNKTSDFFDKEPKDIRETLGRLGKHLGISKLSVENKGRKLLSAQYQETIKLAKSRPSLVRSGLICFFKYCEKHNVDFEGYCKKHNIDHDSCMDSIVGG